MKKNAWKILAAIVSLAIMLSLSLVPVYADETTADTEAATEAVTDAETDTETDAGTDAATDAETGEATSAETKAPTSSGSSSTSNTNNTHFGLVTLIIVAVIVVVIVVVAVIKREKTVKLWRAFKSEFKKIVWADPHDTLKNTILVVIAIVVFAAVLGLLDYLLSLLVVAIGTAI